MSRSLDVINGLKSLRDYLSKIPVGFFESSRDYQPSVKRVDPTTGVKTEISKDGYTSSGMRMIHYIITFEDTNATEAHDELKLYVKPSEDDDPEVCRRLVALGIEHLINTGIAVTMTTKAPEDL